MDLALPWGPPVMDTIEILPYSYDIIIAAV